MDNRHSAIIQIGNAVAFIDGIPNDHVCDSKEMVFTTACGKTLRWYSVREWAGYTWELREQLFHKHFHILSGSVACSICGSAAIDRAPWL